MAAAGTVSGPLIRLARILCEQPAIWAVPVAIGLMVVVSKLTRREVPLGYQDENAGVACS